MTAAGVPAVRPGYAPSVSEIALLIIDMFNDYRHEDGEDLATNVAEMVYFAARGEHMPERERGEPVL